MITIFQKKQNTIETQTLTFTDAIPGDVVWIDLHCPTPEEIIQVERELDIQLPSTHEIWKNNVLNRLYQEKGNAFMTAALITKVDTPYPLTSAVTFILTPGYVLTMREISPTSFQYFTRRIMQSPHQFHSATHILEGLLEEIITRVAHNSEVVVEMLDRLSHSIFNNQTLDNASEQISSRHMQEILQKLGACADLNSKINESLHSLSRLLAFFRQINTAGSEMDNSIATLMTDVAALTQQNAFLSDKITFQLDAMLGMINVEQNMIIKIFSVVTVFFLPPTLLSSMYGMNFSDMPELHWEYGYPMAITLMMLCALLPYLYFRKKGWL